MRETNDLKKLTNQVSALKKKNFTLFDKTMNKKVKPVMVDAWT